MKKCKLLLILYPLLALPVLTQACPLCQAGATKRSQKAYNETIILLASLPLVGGGSIFYWLYTKKKNENITQE
jgi:hypothetical protein